MKTNLHAKRLSMGLGMMLALCVFRAAAEDGDGLRTWISASGMMLRARYESLHDEQLILIREDGARVQIDLDRLSEPDQALARKLAGKSLSDTPIETGPNKLPVFTSGPWRGYHAVYRHAFFDVFMDADGFLSIQLKKDDAALGPPLAFKQACYYVDSIHRARPVKEFHDPPRPSLQPEEIILTGLLDQDIPFETVFEFQDNRIAGWGWCRDHAGVRFPTFYRLMVNVPPSHDIPPHVPQEERMALVEGYELILRERSGRSPTRKSYNYYQAVQFRHAAQDATIVAPMWAPRRVTVRGPRANASMWPWIYPDGSLWQGYSFLLVKPEQDTRRRTQNIEIRID